MENVSAQHSNVQTRLVVIGDGNTAARSTYVLLALSHKQPLGTMQEWPKSAV